MNPPSHQITIRQTFAVDRERAFRAWSDPAEMRRWFSPVGFTTPFAEADLRPGGRYRIGMQPPEGKPVFAGGIYREVVPPERLVFTWSWEEGDALHTGETLVTLEFRKVADGTEVILTHQLLPSEESAAMHHDGWVACMTSLAQYLPAMPLQSPG